MDNQVIEKGIVWLKRALIYKTGKTILKKPAGVLAVGALAAGAGVAVYSYFKKDRKNDLTHIDDIENNNHEIKGEKKIVV